MSQQVVEGVYRGKEYYVSKLMHNDLQTYEMCLEAVKQDGCALKYVKKELQTYEMCLEALIHGSNDCWRHLQWRIVQFELCTR